MLCSVEVGNLIKSAEGHQSWVSAESTKYLPIGFALCRGGQVVQCRSVINSDKGKLTNLIEIIWKLNINSPLPSFSEHLTTRLRIVSGTKLEHGF